jgi:hypothetical protein
MKKLLAMLLFVPSLALATDRGYLVENRYFWTITDDVCGHMANPDNLPLHYAYVEDTQTHNKMEGCALDDGTTVEFQLINTVKKVLITFKIPTSAFTPKHTM